jgi:hypothetical protein
MSIRQKHPRQDRRGLKRVVIRDHAKVPSVGTKPFKGPTILDPMNGRWGNGVRPVTTQA